MEKVRLGVIGTGRLGGFHASKAAANPDVDFIGVYDACESTRKKIASQYDVRDFSSLDELLPFVDAVIVATPSIYHAEVGVRILAAGKHLLMEKPVTTTSKSAQELTRLADRQGVVFQVGHVEQHNPAWRAAMEYLDDVRKGLEPVMVDAVRTSGYSFRSTDVGATLDLMIHDLELTLSLIPSPVERVSAFGFSQMGGLEDASYATLTFENGSVARLKASRIEQSVTRQMTVQAANKTVHIDFGARTAQLVRPKKEVLEGAFAPNAVTLDEMAPRISSFMKEEYETINLVHEPFDALSLEMQNFVSAILHGQESVVPGKRAALAVTIAEEIIRDLEMRSRRNVAGERRSLRIAG